MKLILLGKPGSGKGTQAEKIAVEFGIPQISAGVLLRKIEKDDTPLGREVKSHIDKGSLVPDELVIKMIFERLQDSDCKKGYILDGFPRTVNQAEKLDEKIKIDKVIDIDIPDDVIVNRMANRRSCLKCGATYNLLTKKPKKDEICDVCGTKLTIRADDNPETVRNRLKIYNENTKPLIEHYKKKKLLVTVDGNRAIDVIFEDVKKILK